MRTTARLVGAAGLRQSVLTDRQLLQLVSERGLIEPFERSCLSGAAYDMRIGNILTSRNRLAKVDLRSGDYAMESGECVTVESLEQFDFLSSLCLGVVVNKHSIMARGIFHPATSIDPGFRGPLAVTFFHLGRERVRLSHGEKMAKVFFLPVGEIPERLYGATQRPSYRQGSTEIALLVERPEVLESDAKLAKMYGRPVERLYERMAELESDRELRKFRRDDEIRRRGRRRIWEVLIALLSGAAGALLAQFGDDVVRVLSDVF